MLSRVHTGLFAGLMLCSAGALAAPFTLHSTQFHNAGKLPVAMGGGGQCPGQNVSPQLSWSGAPANTKSYVLLIEDPQGANGLGMTHFLGYGIDSSRHQFAKGDLTGVVGYTPGTNGKNVQGYSGPCPPVNGDIHNYNFTLIATDYAPDALQKGLAREAVMSQLKGHVLASAGLIGQFIMPKK
ncbi:Phospholipid-binding protein [Pantoea sp. AS-PWVM4]|uniref:YbhB/YbcL family Raf kinase inhibitor-like protein n=1 Tax=Pantoea sp. AS-PWVM4 TaxID=1332069 RepID=UPI0003AC806D|nr:YbhB/YbcL family Raf kinase inhibitor-like protein [Pantoea sp. AS-PWVM4]ERK16233.1 Phospholipid-binding protein [Pantoea sp. AS-PWVM4]